MARPDCQVTASVLFRARIFAAPAETLPDLHDAQDVVHQKIREKKTRAPAGATSGRQ
jgi:hypothetical protein